MIVHNLKQPLFITIVALFALGKLNAAAPNQAQVACKDSLKEWWNFDQNKLTKPIQYSEMVKLGNQKDETNMFHQAMQYYKDTSDAKPITALLEFYQKIKSSAIEKSYLPEPTPSWLDGCKQQDNHGSYVPGKLFDEIDQFIKEVDRTKKITISKNRQKIAYTSKTSHEQVHQELNELLSALLLQYVPSNDTNAKIEITAEALQQAIYAYRSLEKNIGKGYRCFLTIINKKNNDGKPLLQLFLEKSASTTSYSQDEEKLLDYFCKLDKKILRAQIGLFGRNVFHMSTLYHRRNEALFKKILKDIPFTSSELTKESKSGKTPLDIAIAYKNDEAAIALVNKMSCIEYLCSFWQENPRDKAIKHNLPKLYKVLAETLECPSRQMQHGGLGLSLYLVLVVLELANRSYWQLGPLSPSEIGYHVGSIVGIGFWLLVDKCSHPWYIDLLMLGLYTRIIAKEVVATIPAVRKKKPKRRRVRRKSR